MAGFKVDEMGNCWAADDTEHRFPVMAHPELEGAAAKCPKCGSYKWRKRLPRPGVTEAGPDDSDFEWRCGCGEVFAGFHH
jgi:hypothetical protein